jgi:hypothetical protein
VFDGFSFNGGLPLSILFHFCVIRFHEASRGDAFFCLRSSSLGHKNNLLWGEWAVEEPP